ncbi:protein of unknown function [Candidatus Nitrosocaldus cavascurensis]|uniref:Uncharacterized protein n=1 Tax=Candidatus Nitrosocaldus cavascurensis TaxID=2058097 RepID=A0A2K5ARH1_9ARCH|nr:protein of unknown function [Candidatus Nitrosocaldus cavascurensis]
MNSTNCSSISSNSSSNSNNNKRNNCSRVNDYISFLLLFHNVGKKSISLHEFYMLSGIDLATLFTIIAKLIKRNMITYEPSTNMLSLTEEGILCMISRLFRLERRESVSLIYYTFLSRLKKGQREIDMRLIPLKSNTLRFAIQELKRKGIIIIIKYKRYRLTEKLEPLLCFR